MDILSIVKEVAEIRLDRCIGRLALRGHRIELKAIIEFLESKWSVDEIIKEFPTLERNLIERIKENFSLLKRLVEGMELVEIDPNKLAGLPVVRGTRMPVVRVYELLENGMSIYELLTEFPSLRLWDIERLPEYKDVLYPVLKYVHERLTAAFHKKLVKLL